MPNVLQGAKPKVFSSLLKRKSLPQLERLNFGILSPHVFSLISIAALEKVGQANFFRRHTPCHTVAVRHLKNKCENFSIFDIPTNFVVGRACRLSEPLWSKPLTREIYRCFCGGNPPSYSQYVYLFPFLKC